MFEKNDTKIYKFSNGATLIYRQDCETKTTKIASGFIAGAQKDIIPGTAHFLEHIMVSPRTAQKTFAKKYNVKTSGFTTYDFICFETTSLSKYLDSQMQILEEIVLCDDFDQKLIERERQAILIEDVLVLGKQNTIDSNYFETTNKNTGGEENIKKITSDYLKQYKDENFVAENFVMAVTSDLSFKAIKQYAENIVNNLVSQPQKKNNFHQIKKKHDISYYVYKQSPFMKTVRVELSIKNDVIAEIANRNNIIDEYIFNSPTGLLHQKLRLENGYAYYAKLANTYGENNDNYKTFTIDTSKINVNKVLYALGEILKSMKNGLSTQQFEDFQNAMKANKEENNHESYLTSKNMFIDYVKKGYVVLDDPMDMVLNFSRDELNKYLHDAFLKKNIVLNIVGDMDLKTILRPTVIQNIFDTRPFRYLLMKGDKNYYFDTETNNFIDPALIKDNSVAFYKVVDSHGKLIVEKPNEIQEIKSFSIPKPFKFPKAQNDDEKQQ